MTQDRNTQPAPSRGTYRKLWIGDLGIFVEHLERLDREAKYLRFGGGTSPQFLKDHARKALQWPGIVDGYFIDGILRGTGELQPLPDSFPLEAEAAFTVEKPFRGQGVGTELMRRAIISAQNRHITTIYTICMVENQRMRRLAQKYKAELRIEHNEISGMFRTPAPTHLSVMEEWLSDACGLINNALRR